MASQRWGVTGPVEVLVRHVLPMTIAYLTSLNDLSVPDDELASSFVAQTINVAESASVTSVRQLAVSGITASERIEHNGIAIRPLTELERGSILEANGGGRIDRRPRVDRVRTFNPVQPAAAIDSARSTDDT